MYFSKKEAERWAIEACGTRTMEREKENRGNREMPDAPVEYQCGEMPI